MAIGVLQDQVIAVEGDLARPKLGVKPAWIKKHAGKIDHFFHLAAIYDMKADAESQVQVNVEGTRNVVEFAKAVDAGHLHHVSSIAATGLQASLTPSRANGFLNILRLMQAQAQSLAATP